MKEAREEAAADDVEQQDTPEVREEDDGQLAIGGPGTEPKFSTDAGGYPPTSAELAIKAKKLPWEEDLRRGSQLLLLAWVYVDEVRVASTKTVAADVVRLAEVPHPDLRPGEAVEAMLELKSRQQHDQACIDQAAALAEEILNDDAGVTGLEMAEAIRTQLYERHHIAADAHEATHGITDDEADSEQPTSEPALAASV